MSAWQIVETARDINRPRAKKYIDSIFDDFIELHGDRCFGDDKSIVGGIAYLKSRPVTVIAQQRGNNLAEHVERNFGMPNPEGYRKAIRLMRQAEKFRKTNNNFY